MTEEKSVAGGGGQAATAATAADTQTRYIHRYLVMCRTREGYRHYHMVVYAGASELGDSAEAERAHREQCGAPLLAIVSHRVLSLQEAREEVS